MNKSSRKNYALCLIDLQKEFEESITDDLLTNVEREVRQAIKYNRDILIVLYHGYGPLIREVSLLLKDYPNKFTIWKFNDGGGSEVTAALSIRPQHIRVCGVNTDACVLDTVATMSDLFQQHNALKRKRIQVVGDACWSCYDHIAGLEVMSRYPKVEIVNWSNLYE